jgi:hypothetical protein
MTIFQQQRGPRIKLLRWAGHAVQNIVRLIIRPRAALTLQTSLVGDFAKQEVIIITIRNLRAKPLVLKGVGSVPLGALTGSEYVRMPSRSKPLHRGDVTTHFYYPDQILGQPANLENIAYVFAYDEGGKQYRLRIASMRSVYWRIFLRRLSQLRRAILGLIAHQASSIIKRRTY